ncbi:MAG: hypothetical protein WB711_22500 [Terriglobales bacterium]
MWPVSVFVRQKKGRRAPVGFRDNPELHSGTERVRGQNPPAVQKAEFILVAVALVNIAPLASQVSLQKREW